MPDFFVAPPGGGLIAGGIYSEVTTVTGQQQVAGQGYVFWGMSTPTPAAAPTGMAASVATGANPLDTSYSIFGHTIPLSVLGLGRIGGELISGPWTDGVNVSGGISYGVPADPTGTRTLVEIAFDSEVVWTLADGFKVEPFTFRWYGGTLTQAADALETAHFGSHANAYRPQMMLFIDTLPLGNTKFNRFPYVACKMSDGSGTDVNWGEAFARLAASPWVNFPAFETIGITDGLPDGGLIITQDSQFLQLIQQAARFYPNWDILQTDKLRIVDRGSTVTADIALDATRLTGAVTVTRQGQDTIAKDLELSTIDPDSDYMIIPSLAQRPRDPVVVTTSVGKDTAYLPAIMNAQTRTSIVTYAKYHEVQASKTISGTAMAYGLEIEPGVLVDIVGLGDDFNDETFKIVETLHGANYTVEFIGQAILKCFFGNGDPHWARVVLLMGYEDVNGSTGSPGLDDESIAHHGTATAIFSAQVSTGQSRFGAASIDVHTGPLLFPASTDWVLSSANSDQFTVECSVYFNSIADCSLLGVWGGGFHQSWALVVLSTSHVQFDLSTTGATLDVSVDGAASLTTGAWYQIAADKDATGKIRVYVNGTMIASATPANSAMYDPGEGLYIGANQLLLDKVNGYMDEVRITKGVARYASDSGYVTATAAFPRF